MLGPQSSTKIGSQGVYMKKYDIIDTATRLFATQGFDGTTTLQIAREAKVTEPLIYYHFEGKDDLFTHIIRNGYEAYFSRLESLNNKTSTQFEKIENLFALHFDFIKERPDEIYLAVSACPAKLKDAKHVCTQNIEKQRKWISSYLRKCIKAGMASGEFCKVPVPETVMLLIAFINGIIRQRTLKIDSHRGMKKAVVAFCRRSLVQ
jgi:AcrR family transcriptional regulator